MVWHVAHAMVLLMLSCSSKNRIFPSTRLLSVIGFSAGTGTGGITAYARYPNPTAAVHATETVRTVTRPARRRMVLMPFLDAAPPRGDIGAEISRAVGTPHAAHHAAPPPPPRPPRRDPPRPGPGPARLVRLPPPRLRNLGPRSLPRRHRPHHPRRHLPPLPPHAPRLPIDR